MDSCRKGLAPDDSVANTHTHTHTLARARTHTRLLVGVKSTHTCSPGYRILFLSSRANVSREVDA
eukprot:768465-Amphidinium_carterae.1